MDKEPKSDHQDSLNLNYITHYISVAIKLFQMNMYIFNGPVTSIHNSEQV